LGGGVPIFATVWRGQPQNFSFVGVTSRLGATWGLQGPPPPAAPPPSGGGGGGGGPAPLPSSGGGKGGPAPLPAAPPPGEKEAKEGAPGLKAGALSGAGATSGVGLPNSLTI